MHLTQLRLEKFITEPAEGQPPRLEAFQFQTGILFQLD